MSEAGRASVQDNVGGALRFLRENWRGTALIAAIGAGASTALALAALGFAQAGATLGVAIPLAATLISAAIYTAFYRAVLDPPDARTRLAQDALRVWGAMAVLSFFLVIVLFALMLPCAVLLAPFLTPYASEIAAAGQDEAQLMAIATRFAQENPAAIALIMIGFGAVVLLLTSRFYLSGPASVEARRILTFETWNWTKHNMLRIAGARLMLLGPAYVLSLMLTLLLGRAFGVDVLQAEQLRAFAVQSPFGFGLYNFVSDFVAIGFYNALEAGLSVHFYRALKQPLAARAV